MRYLACLLVTMATLAPASCSRSGPDSAPASDANGGGGGVTDEAGAGAGGEAKPIALTDARLDQYMAYRKEWNKVYAEWFKDTGEMAKAVDSKSNELSKAFTVAAHSQKLGEKYEKALSALRAKYGFTEDDDDRLSSAISEVVGAKVLDNPLMGDAAKVYREMQAKGGDEKKVADEMLKSMEEQEKQALAAARTAYGDACVDVLSKRIKELGQFQIDLMKELADQVQKDAETK